MGNGEIAKRYCKSRQLPRRNSSKKLMVMIPGSQEVEYVSVSGSQKSMYMVENCNIFGHDLEDTAVGSI
ncbi:hypothetical protein BDQ17DRAFT_1345450 [Cyathus striatus]|nr:hypothetical protein BDQ17DRAFT_1345450 [Cyathus striatus]